MDSRKYGRTYHFPFSPGTTSDGRFNYTYWEDILKFRTLLFTEKLDGENNCLSSRGVFARSHAAPTTSAWTNQLRERWQLIKSDLGDLELFGENLYAIHSIEYKNIEDYFFVFAARIKDVWLSWDEIVFYAKLFDFPTVPVLDKQEVKDLTQDSLEKRIIALAQEDSVFGALDSLTGLGCTREGVVCRNMDEFTTSDFQHSVFKYVRKGHVKTDIHWTRNWKRAKLSWERKMEDNI